MLIVGVLEPDVNRVESTAPYYISVKGLVHPKMKILSVFTHPHVVPLTTIVCIFSYYGSQ